MSRPNPQEAIKAIAACVKLTPDERAAAYTDEDILAVIEFVPEADRLRAIRARLLKTSGQHSSA